MRATAANNSFTCIFFVDVMKVEYGVGVGRREAEPTRCMAVTPEKYRSPGCLGGALAVVDHSLRSFAGHLLVTLEPLDERSMSVGL